MIERKEFRHAECAKVEAWLRENGMQLRAEGWLDPFGEASATLTFEPAYRGPGRWVGVIRAGSVSL